MPDKELRKLLQKLSSEIENTQKVDKSSKEMLDKIRDDIDDLLERDDKKISDKHLSLMDQLKDSTEQFEASHPELTAIMNNVINFLNNLGI